MRIAIAADHAGVDLRDQIAHHLRLKGYDVDDLSPENDPDDDYPLIVEPLARAIASGRYARGIFCCGSGIGPLRRTCAARLSPVTSSITR